MLWPPSHPDQVGEVRTLFAPVGVPQTGGNAVARIVEMDQFHSAFNGDSRLFEPAGQKPLGFELFQPDHERIRRGEVVKGRADQQKVAGAVDAYAMHLHAGGKKVVHNVEPFEMLESARVHDGRPGLVGGGG